MLKTKMCRNFNEPCSYPNADEFRFVDMLTAASTVEKKEDILDNFVGTKGRFHLLLQHLLSEWELTVSIKGR